MQILMEMLLLFLHLSKFGHGDITGDGGIEFWSNRKKVTTKWFQITNQNWMS